METSAYFNKEVTLIYLGDNPFCLFSGKIRLKGPKLDNRNLLCTP